MSRPLRLFVAAGEASGDRIGAALVRDLRQGGPVEIVGVGGPELKAEGLDSLFPMEDLSVMGFADVLKRLPLLLYRLHQTTQAVERLQPDIAVFIDSQVFSKTVAGRLAKRGSPIPRILYVSPAVWGWGPERAKALAPIFEHVLAVLPFEPAVMVALEGPPTTYVGHPALARTTFRNAVPDRGPFLLLPGSRPGELRRHLALFGEVAKHAIAHSAVSELVLPTLPGLVPFLKREIAKWTVPVRLVTGAERDTAWHRAVGALAVSGTVTLELALSGIPHVVTYCADPVQARGYLALNRDQPIALPNILAGRRIVPEVGFLGRPEPSALARAVNDVLDSPEQQGAQVAAFAEIRVLMQKGAPGAPLQSAAPIIRRSAQRREIGS